MGACYVLDEPSIGLHSRDTGRLIRILEELRDLGNTIVVVEHDADVMRAADHIIDMGPGAGELGGEIIFEGSYRKILANGAASLTSRYLRGDLHADSVGERREVDPKPDGEVLRRARPQSEGHRRRHSAEHDGRGDGRFGIGQIDAGARRDLSIADAAAAASRPEGFDEEQESEGSRKSPAAAWKRRSCCARWCWWINRPSAARRARTR